MTRPSLARRPREMCILYQITPHKITVPLTASCKPMSLFEWLAMPQDGGSASPGWFVRVVNGVINELE